MCGIALTSAGRSQPHDLGVDYDHAGTFAHLKVSAEGVKLEDQAKILRLLRCDYMQGFLTGKPMPFDAVTNFIKAG
jgi:predicted signal transduction protein with EAL and GGDEF domain